LAAVQWFGLKGSGLGWYCLLVSLNAMLYAMAALDNRLCAMWLLWASLWSLFFVSLGLRRYVRYLGFYTIGGVVTCWVPSMSC
jgi:putative amide transporter protein